jgi:hypothetical protein
VSIAAQIRKAALGRAPHDVESLALWIGPGPSGVFLDACEFCRTDDLSMKYLHGADETHARTFLLFVACALEG